MSRHLTAYVEAKYGKKALTPYQVWQLEKYGDILPSNPETENDMNEESGRFNEWYTESKMELQEYEQQNNYQENI